MSIGMRIKKKRLELKMSQEELAKKVGYKSRSSIQKIEAARDLPLKKVAKMALALDCSPGYLMGWEGEGHLENERTFVVPLENIRKPLVLSDEEQEIIMTLRGLKENEYNLLKRLLAYLK